MAMSQIFLSFWTSFLFSLIITDIKSAAAIKCVQCDYAEMGMACLMKPPKATDCYVAFKHCMTTAVFTDSGKVESFNRSCGPYPFGDECNVDRAGTSTVCYATCAKNACNARHTLLYLMSLITKRT